MSGDAAAAPAEAKAKAKTLRPRDAATLIIVDRTGNAPRVLNRTNGEVVTAKDIGGASWILFDGPYQLDFWTARSQDIGRLHLFTGADSRLGRSSKQAWPEGSVLQIDLGEAVHPGMGLFGFNAAESWGRWTAQPVVEVELPPRPARASISFWSWMNFLSWM